MSDTSSNNLSFQPVRAYYQRWRLIKDNLVRYSVVAGGLGVIAAIALIFFYLLFAVFPLFLAPETHALKQYAVPEIQLGNTVLLATEEQNEIGVRFTDQAIAVFFDLESGKAKQITKITLPENTTVTSFAQASQDTGVVAYGLNDGRVVVVKHEYKISYPNDVRLITPEISYPLGVEAIVVDANAQAITKLALQVDSEVTTFVVKTADNKVSLKSFTKQESLFGDEFTLEQTGAVLEANAAKIQHILLDKDQRNVYLATATGHISFFNVRKKSKPEIIQNLNIIATGIELTSLSFLNGDLSLLVGDSSGLVAQWSKVRDIQGQPILKKLREFKVSNAAITHINPEQRRKGFIVTDANGLSAVYHSTAERELLKTSVTSKTPVALVFSPRANRFLLQTAQELHVWEVDNEHPEISWQSLWQEVWYESYSEADYIWQSSSSSNDFEPKMSLTPLVFGTLKAAFYTMLVATPLALMGAIYTAYFMTAGMRRYVKPGIEMMGALPTVILGFLAGLWLAPFVEQNLTALFALLMIVPLSVMVFAYLWQYLPATIRQRIPDGYEAAILIPVIILATGLAFLLSVPIENLCFGGSMQGWLQNQFGIGYDQRNSLVVGIAMGVAVIPTIFSITEDAIFSVPKHLTIGSLALGATPWQTMIRVVLLTASPGIFSAIMIGFGRAVGETMIVLMATGNTPVMDLSVFQGMRTLSANIAVEIPESEVDSTHYRVLFLAALVLFLFTFIFNTLAEVIRQRLREKYSSL